MQKIKTDQLPNPELACREIKCWSYLFTMTEKDLQPLIDYVSNWNNIEGIKPQNEKKFLDYFLLLIKNYPDDREVVFNGEGSYFGKQITLEPFSYWGRPNHLLCFEVSYNENKISVYSASNCGFWVPEFISLSKGDDLFEEVKKVLFDFLYVVFGLPNNLQNG